MMTDAQVKALTNDIKVRNVIHMLQEDLRKALAVAMDPKDFDPVFEFYDEHKLVSVRHQMDVKTRDDTIHALELQLHDDQTLREDYNALLLKYDDAMAGIAHYKEAVHRDEETIATLKAKIGGPIERSETFKEVRIERDQALKKLDLLTDTLKEVQAKLAKVKDILYNCDSHCTNMHDSAEARAVAVGQLRDLLGMD